MLCLSRSLAMANVFPPSSKLCNKVILSEAELAASADELSKDCAALVLDEPLSSTFDMATAGFLGVEVTKSSSHVSGVAFPQTSSRLCRQKKSMQGLHVQEQILEEQGDTFFNISKKSIKGKELKDSSSNSRGTGVFIPTVISIEKHDPSKGTGVFIQPHLAYASSDLQKKKGEEKAIQIEKKIAGKQTESYFEVTPNISLPQEWPYEYSL